MDNLEINLIGASPRYDDGIPVIVAGFYHSFEFDSSEANIVLEKNNVSYNWYYENGWKGDTDYIDFSSSEKSENHFKLVSGLEADVEIGIWDLIINDNSFQVKVEKPTKGASLSSADFQFQFEPYTSITKDSSPQKFRFSNEGNSLISYKTNFNKLSSRINLSNGRGVLKPGDQIESTISFTSGKWEPGHIQIKGTIKTSPAEIISNATLQFVEEYAFEISIDVYIGHSGYEITPISEGLTIQYQDNTDLGYDQTKSLRLYLSGDKTVTVNIEGEKVKIKSVKGEGKDQIPFTLDMEEGQEYVFNITIKPQESNTEGKVVYTINDGTDKTTYETIIDIGRAPPPTNDNTSDNISKFINIIIIVVGIIAMIVFFLVIKAKRRS